MDQFVGQLGIDWRLLVSQAVNFLIVLVVLRIFLYKPILSVLHDRRTKIEEGLTKATEADRRLGEIEVLKKEKMGQAESEILEMFKTSGTRLKGEEEKRMKDLEKKTSELMRNAELAASQRKTDFDSAMQKEAVNLIRQSIEKIAALEPKLVDEALIKEALKETAAAK